MVKFFLCYFGMQDLSSVVVLHLHRSPQLQATTSNAATVTSCSMSYNSGLQCSRDDHGFGFGFKQPDLSIFFGFGLGFGFKF